MRENAQNPGWVVSPELTSSEILTIQSISALGDPGADRILFWDESANAYAFLTVGSGLTLTDTTLTASGGSGDVSKVGTPVNNQIGIWTGDGTIEGDVDLTFDGDILSSKAISITGTAGAGFQSFATQSSDPTTPASGTVNLYAANTPSGIARLEMQTSTGAVLALFRDSVTTIRNETGSTITKGSVVYINGANGTTSTVALAQSNSAATSADIGIALANISNNAFGTVQREGLITGIDTLAFTAGDTLWLSSTVAGGLTNTEPSAPNFGMKIGTVVLSSASGIIDIFIQPFVPSRNYGSFGTLNSPLILGGSSTTQDLTLQTTSGVGATGADMHFKVGNNGGTEAMTILNNGNVGIGTTSPTQKLLVDNGNIHINTPNSSTAGNGLRLNRPGATYAGFEIATNNVVDWSIGANSSGFGIYEDGQAATTRLIIKDGGNVGIGTTSPTAVLHLKAGTATANTAPLKLTSGTDLTTPEAGAFEYDGTNLHFTPVATRKTIAFTEDITSGYVPYTGATSNVDLGTYSLTTPNILGGTSTTQDLTLQTTSGIGTTGADMHFKVGNNGATESITILNNGSVGISNTNPLYALDVTGSIKSSDSIIAEKSGSYASFVGETSSDTAWHGTYIGFHRSRGTSASKTTVVADDAIGWYDYLGYDGTSDVRVGVLRMVVDGAVSTGIVPGKFQIETADATGANTPRLIAYANDNIIMSTNGGKVGIAQLSPGYKLHVGNNTVAGVVARFENSTGTCDVNPTTTALVCSSDINLKKNILTIKEEKEFILQTIPDITGKSTYDKFMNLTPVKYNWKTEEDGVPKHVGFIAQEVEQIFPDLVFTDATTGRKSVALTNLIPYTVEVIQEMNLKIKDLASLDISSSTSLGSLIKNFLTNAENTIGSVFFGEVNTKKLCLDDLCITKDELKKILDNNNTTVTLTPTIDTTVTSPEIPSVVEVVKENTDTIVTPQEEVISDSTNPSIVETSSDTIDT
ncbi:tail fiber domain-containing protein, partial [Candidatus Dojkabacteria bacterium]|nr:tail fiber domain-containing protein [Candidatus Dojkabacteria bacterium]